MTLCIPIRTQYAGHEIGNFFKGKLTPCTLAEKHWLHLSARLDFGTCQNKVIVINENSVFKKCRDIS